MKYKLENQSVSIVWVAPISPQLFMPSWFEQFELLQEEEIKQARVSLKEDGVNVDFGWLEVSATVNRVIFRLAKVGLENTFIDLVSSVVSLLETTPTAALGINTNYVHSFKNRDDYDLLGDTLVPKALWKDENKSLLIQYPNDNYHFGMKRLVLEIAPEEDYDNSKNLTFREAINLSLIPRIKQDNIEFGLFSIFNHHYKSTIDPDSTAFTKIIPDLLKEMFQNAVKNDITTLESMYMRILK